MPTDLVGAASNGGTRSYTFTANEVGTFLYEAGPLANSPHQVAMGLYGALVVLPPTGNSFGSDSDTVVLVSEIDPALNGAANKAGFDMRKLRAEVHPHQRDRLSGHDTARSGGARLRRVAALRECRHQLPLDERARWQPAHHGR